MKLLSRRGASRISHALIEDAEHTFGMMQPGLLYPAPFMSAVAVNLEESAQKRITREQLGRLASVLRDTVHQRCPGQHGSAVISVALRLWSQICGREGRPVPSAMKFEVPAKEDPFVPAGLGEMLAIENGREQEPSILVVLKTDRLEGLDILEAEVSAQLSRLGLRGTIDATRTRNPAIDAADDQGTRVLGGRFHETLRNPVCPVEMLEHVVVGSENPAGRGGSFLCAQRFFLNWDELRSKTPLEVDAIIGRRAHTDELAIDGDTRTHIRASHTYDHEGHTIKILRQGFPFGTADQSPLTSVLTGSTPATCRDEKGVFFIGLANRVSRVERILRSQSGTNPLFTRDRLLSGALARSDLGGFYYVPSVQELSCERLEEDARRRRMGEPLADWRRFPGVDWTRLVRHYQRRSENGLMFYNHRDYLFEMGTATGERAEHLEPPSLRVQFLLERLFSRWDDTWYRSQKPAELRHLRDYLLDHFRAQARLASGESLALGGGEPEAMVDAVMAKPVVVRAAWAVRMMLGRVAVDQTATGRRGNGGMDLCDVHPLDLLAGSMPAQSLGEGKYLIDYSRDEGERRLWFNNTLGPTSGVGHVVPGYEELLAGGIKGLENRTREKANAISKDPEATHRADELSAFYEAHLVTLLALREYLTGLASCVAAKRAGLNGHRTIETENLESLEARLLHLGGGAAPRTMLEAAQLVYSVHACLHLVGEPVAVGRLDRLLRPFYTADIRKEDFGDAEAQEIVDCFWIKLGEKVLLNRVFIDDRQQLGNMAMGNRAGAYPKGQSVNQWIQQVTVGGQNADGTWELSDVTLFCLKAARRLPFNAPVLSLRVGKEMPQEWRARLLEEAARGMLSGGASPILLNDDKIVPGLIGSGDEVGPEPGSSAARRWHSTVRRADAYDYACDGCYEPQFCGANWFTLGGIQTLIPLEYALNEGRQIGSAGPVHLRGRTGSFRSPPAYQIGSYEQLEALFLKHLTWLYSKQLAGTLRDFGRVADVCPSPLLNHFIDDCLTKGRDIYAGGARYNVFGPCFTTLANTVNSLWAIRSMCFDPVTSVTNLSELVASLLTNWGHAPIDPLVHTTVLERTNTRVADTCGRFQYLRRVALGLPKWGRAETEIDEFGNRICARVAAAAMDVVRNPSSDLRAQFTSLAERFGTEAQPFGGISMQPGVGTFASYVEQGLGCGASADGRLHGQPVATDLSPSPIPLDIPLHEAEGQEADLAAVLAGVTTSDSYGFTNGSPFDANVRELFGASRLAEVLGAFSDGIGTNILTVTTADRETFERAADSPETYDLLRVRMGGWTEMFVAMHAAHQGVHPRRPIST